MELNQNIDSVRVEKKKRMVYILTIVVGENKHPYKDAKKKCVNP